MLLKSIFLTKFLWFVDFSIKSMKNRFKNVFFVLIIKTTLNYLSFETNLASVAQVVQNWDQFKEELPCQTTIFLYFTPKTAHTSNWHKIKTNWPKSMKFWHKKRQSMLFKEKLISDHSIDASLRKSLKEFFKRDWWLCTLLILSPLYSFPLVFSSFIRSFFFLSFFLSFFLASIVCFFRFVFFRS